MFALHITITLIKKDFMFQNITIKNYFLKICYSR